MSRKKSWKASRLRKIDRRKILVLDTETTGINPLYDEILQLSIIDGNGSVLFNSYIRPEHRKRWPRAEKVNGITYAMVKDLPTLSEKKAEIKKILRHAKLIVGYNVVFDVSFLEHAGIYSHCKLFDVMDTFSKYKSLQTHTYKKYTLAKCAEEFGYYFSPHNSLDDTIATLHCFNQLIGYDETAQAAHRKKRFILLGLLICIGAVMLMVVYGETLATAATLLLSIGILSILLGICCYFLRLIKSVFYH